MESVVSNDVEVKGLKFNRRFLERVVCVTQTIRHKSQVARRAVDQDQIHALLELDLRHVDWVNMLDGRRPGPGRQHAERHINQYIGLNHIHRLGQTLAHLHAGESKGLTKENGAHLIRQVVRGAGGNPPNLAGIAAGGIDDYRPDVRLELRHMLEQILKQPAHAVYAQSRLGHQVIAQGLQTSDIFRAAIKGETLMWAKADACSFDGRRCAITLQSKDHLVAHQSAPPYRYLAETDFRCGAAAIKNLIIRKL